MLTDSIEEEKDYSGTFPTGEWFDRSGKPYMDLAKQACPPDSYARNADRMSEKEVEKRYKLESGFISNFNLSSDLCTVGPTLANLHGLLFSASTIIASHKLIPIFGECKVNINSDSEFEPVLP